MVIGKRFWEIDFLRGTAIIMMIIYHLIFDLNYFNIYNLNLSGFWWLFARATASIFIFLVGVSLTLSYSRAKIQKSANFLKYLKRGMKIFSYGLAITLITWVFLKESFVKFGILHLIGLSIILAYPFLNKKYLNLMFGAIFILLGIFLADLINIPLLFWLFSQNSSAVDYTPIFPWFGLVLIGIFAGNLLYQDHERKFSFPEISNPFTKAFCFLGKHSLLIYLIHQPIILTILYFFGANIIF